MTSLARRLAMLERERPRRWSPASRRFAARVAAYEGVDAAELIAGTERFLDRATAAGMATTVADLCRFAARETSEDPDLVQAETAAEVARWKAAVA